MSKKLTLKEAARSMRDYYHGAPQPQAPSDEWVSLAKVTAWMYDGYEFAPPEPEPEPEVAWYEGIHRLVHRGGMPWLQKVWPGGPREDIIDSRQEIIQAAYQLGLDHGGGGEGVELAEPGPEVVWEDNTTSPRERISRLPDGELLFEYRYTKGACWDSYGGGSLHSLRAAYQLGRQDEKEGRPEHG